MVATVRSQFVARGADGDFAWMIEQPEYADALFLFNDNERPDGFFILADDATVLEPLLKS